MPPLRNPLVLLHSFLCKQKVGDDLDEELRFHIERETEANLAKGVTPDEARRQALIAFGSPERAAEETWKQQSFGFLECLRRDLRYALRDVRRNPLLALTVIVTLALGIGANTAMFTVDYASMIAPLPYPNPEQLVVVWSKVQGDNDWVSAGDFLDWKRHSSAFQSLDAITEDSFNVSAQNQPEFFYGWRSTAGLFRSRGVKFYLGRDFLPEEEQPGRDRVVVLSYRLWKRLGADPNILGKAVKLDSIPHTVVGVWADGIPEERGIRWLCVPLVFKPAQVNRDRLIVLGRLKPGVTIQQAQADMDRVTAEVGNIDPSGNKGSGASVESLKDDFFEKDARLVFWLLLGGVAFVLLIACINVANLLLAKGMSGQKELAVRIALGASRRTIFAQQLVESLLLAFAGGLLSVAVGFAMLHSIAALAPTNFLPHEADLRLNFPVLMVTFFVTTISGLLFGSIPAWYASHINPSETLKEGGRSSTGPRQNRLRRALVVGEFALAFALLVGAGLAIHSFWNLQRLDLGVRLEHVFTFRLHVPDARPKDPEHVSAYYRQILDSVESVPGVSYASAMTGMPLERPGNELQFTIVGRPGFSDPSQLPDAGFQSVTPEYFRTFGIRILKGRPFGPGDTGSRPKVAMVNEEFANQFLNGADPLQQRILVPQIVPGAQKPGSPLEWQIVGVFHNVQDGWNFGQQHPEIYVPFWQSPWPSASIGVRTYGDPTALTKRVTAAVHAVDPDIALGNLRTLGQVRDQVLASDSFIAILYGSFAGIALLLAAVGIYGIVAFSVAQRSHEIAIRMALGAGQNRVVAFVVREGMLLTSIGFCVGMCGAYFVGRAMHSVLFGVDTLDFLALGAVGLILLLASLLACLLPALRATAVIPVQILRSE